MTGSVAGGAHAQPSVPWTPDVRSRHSLELLVDEAGLDLPLMQWPLPRDAVTHALDALPAELPQALSLARDRVRADLRRQAAGALTVTARAHVDGLAGFGDDATPGSSVELRSSLLAGPHVALQLGARVDPRPDPAASGSVLRLDDSAAVTEAGGVQLQAWAHRSWWGPGWQNALALGNNAPALSGVGLQRASGSTSASPWLSWLGPWNAEGFVARSEGTTTPAYPFIFGARFEFRPFSHLEIGIERTAQWGGAGRDQSLHSLLDLVTSANVNANTAAQQAIDPANELAGYDARLRCPDFLRCAVYGQAIGEDMAGHLPSRFLGMLGLEVWSADGSQRFFLESARTSAYRAWFGPPLVGYAYRNYAYPSGYTDAGRWLGDSAGPDSRLTTFGWIDADADSSVRLTVGHVGSRIGAFSPLTFDPRSSGKLLGIAARRSFAWGPTTWTPELDWNRVEAPDGTTRDTRLGLEVSLDLDELARGASTSFTTQMAGLHDDATTRALLGVAAIGSAALFDRVADNYAATHVHDTPSIAIRHVGDALPYAEFGVAGLAWALASDRRASSTGATAVESGLTSLALAEAVKFAVDRARPGEGSGRADFGHARRADSSFPSEHAALAWGVLTPVAQAYDAPWLYGVAAVTNASRVLGRRHWLSDTVAGAVLGYGIGDAFQSHSATEAATEPPRFAIGTRSVAMSMSFR